MARLRTPALQRAGTTRTLTRGADGGAVRRTVLPGRDGLVHISKLGNGKRIGKVEDVVKVGDKIRVEVTDIDNRGKISLVPVQEDAAPAADPTPADAPVEVPASGVTAS